MKEKINQLSRYAVFEEGRPADSYGAYQRLEEIMASDDEQEDGQAANPAPGFPRPERQNKKKRLTAAERDEAQNLLAIVLFSGMRGEVPSNLLFNMSQSASTLDMEYDAAKLALLANHYGPSATHALTMSRKFAKLGMELTFTPSSVEGQIGAFSRVHKSSQAVLDDVFQFALKCIATSPLPQCEIIYTEALNISEYSREQGSYLRLLEQFQLSYDARNGSISEAEQRAVSANRVGAMA